MWFRGFLLGEMWPGMSQGTVCFLTKAVESGCSLVGEAGGSELNQQLKQSH